MENSFFEFCCSDTSSSHWYDKLTKHTIEHSLISARASNTEYIHMYIHTRVCVYIQFMTGEGGGCPNYIGENQVEVLWHAGEILVLCRWPIVI